MRAAAVSACGIVGEIGQAHAAGKDFAHLAAIHVQRGNDDVRGLVVAELQDQFGEVGFDGRDAGGLERGIQLDLGRGHGLDLDDLGGILFAQNVEDDGARFGGIRCPVNDAAGGGAAGFEFLEICAEIREDVSADGGGGGAQLLPVGLFGNEVVALGLDHVGGVGDVLAQLRVAAASEAPPWERAARCAGPSPETGLACGWRVMRPASCGVLRSAGENFGDVDGPQALRLAGAARRRGASGNCCRARCNIRRRSQSTS